MNRYQKRVRVFAAALSALAGFVDAIGFVESGGFFVSFMSGNSTRLGVGLASSLSHVAFAGGIVLAFVLGVAGGSLVGHGAGARRAGAVLLAIALLLAAAAGAGLAGWGLVAIGLTALAMGAENAIFEREGEVRIGLTYMTWSLVRAGQGLAGMVLGRAAGDWPWYLVLWGGFVGGAAGGAAVYPALGLTALFAAGAVALGLATIADRLVSDAA
jgi:uncharacterized membrane protein YoaK (UPF0700 family)